jgi:hypothetical protein
MQGSPVSRRMVPGSKQPGLSDRLTQIRGVGCSAVVSGAARDWFLGACHGSFLGPSQLGRVAAAHTQEKPMVQRFVRYAMRSSRRAPQV